jgi:type III pantothenate kinase
MNEVEKNVPPVLAFDIGNTNLHAAIIDTARYKCLTKTHIPSKVSPLHIDKLLMTLGEINTDTPVRIASVVKSATEELGGYLTKKGFTNIEFVTADQSCGLTFEYSNPVRLGADRIADALYAVKTFPDRNVIIVDAGSAITIEMVTKDKAYKGGAILPGLSTQLKSLSIATDALPFIENQIDNAELPGKSTEQCIMAGVLFGITGGINEIVNQLQEQLQETPLILGTGGDFANLQPLLNFMSLYLPDLTLVGTALYRT